MLTRHNTPGVSIIMPVLNAGGYLTPAVNSILRQTYANIELIIIDDHSTDKAIEEQTHLDARIRLLKNPGQGIVAALNHGINSARFDYIARMDADDIALPNRIAAQIDYLKTNPDIQVCATQVEIFHAHREVAAGYQHYQNWINTLTQPDEIALNIFIESPVPHPSAMMKRCDWHLLNGYSDTDWPEDYDLWLRAAMKKFRFGKPQGVLLRWRDHDNRLSRQSRRYDKKSFLRAKAYYLCQGYKDRNFRIWGSGPTGACLHDEIIGFGGVVKDFIDVAAKRVGGTKRNKPVVSAYSLAKTTELILVSVSARGAREEIKQYLNRRGFVEGVHYLCVA